MLFDVKASYISLIELINLRRDEYPSDSKLDSFDYYNKFHDVDEINKFNKLHNVRRLKLVPINLGDCICHWKKKKTRYLFIGTPL